MRDTYIKLITCIALVAIFLLQGIWLYNTYTFLDKEVKNTLEELFSRSIEREVYYRLDYSKSQRTPGSVVEGARPDRDFYLNALAFNEYLLSYNIPISMENLDSIWQQKLVDNNITTINYSLFLTDSTNNIIKQINPGIESKTHFSIHLKKPFREDHSEYIQAIIESPHKIVLEKMLLLLIASLAMAIIIGYCFYLQVRIIMRQNRIAEIRKDFTHAMIHDMKNPITTILMSANTLKGGKLDDKIELKKQYFDIISKEGDHLLSLANKVLTIAKFEEKKITLARGEVDIEQLFDKLINTYQLATAKKIEFITDYNGVSTICADQEYIYDVFANLIDNAIKYSKSHVIIHITCRKENNKIRISIKDNGIGISVNDQQRIFNKFERVLSGKEEAVSGFGLGLNYVHQVIEAHAGEVKVESIPDKYSEFTIILPDTYK